MSTILNSLAAYGPKFQTKVLSALLTDKEFLINIHDTLNDEDFDSQSSKWIVKEILKHYSKYHCNISMDTLKIELKKLDNEVLQISVKEQLREAYKLIEEDLEYVKIEFGDFCKNQQLKTALLNSVELLNAGDYDSIRILIDNALKVGQDKNIGHEYDKDIESRYREDNRKPISTPWDQFNVLFQGGLGSGDFGLIFGNPGGGKSWCLIALGAEAVKLGYNVIHYTLELSEDYVGKRYDACFTQIPVNEITNHKSKVEQTINNLPGKLIIKEFPTGRATMTTIESHVKKCINMGTKPDLIIIDYVDLLRSKRKSIDKKEEIDDIYVATKGLAKYLKLPIWSVSQVNRTGAKDNVIEGTSAAGSYDKVMISDIALSLSRKKEDKINGTGRFHIMKNRYGSDGMTYEAIIDTSTGDFNITKLYDEDEEIIPPTQSNNNINNLERKQLANKFFELSYKI
jgi:replicative DNA helicase